MCRGKDICSELGANPEKWDKHGPIRTPEWMTAEVERFVAEVGDFLAGDRNACLEKISQIRSDEIPRWYVESDHMFGRHPKFSLGATLRRTHTLLLTTRQALHANCNMPLLHSFALCSMTQQLYLMMWQASGYHIKTGNL